MPVPDDLNAVARKLVKAPYSSFWNMDPSTDAAWREVLAKAAESARPGLAAARRRLDVSIAPTTLGGVKAFILTPGPRSGGAPGPADLPHPRRRRVRTGKAAIMAAYGGYKVISIDYRMPPDHPYPAALDDLVAAWRALSATTDPRRVAVEGTAG